MSSSAWIDPGLVDNSAAMLALASEVVVDGMGRAGGGSVYIDVYMHICIFMHKGDTTLYQGPPA